MDGELENGILQRKIYNSKKGKRNLDFLTNNPGSHRKV